MNQKTLGNTISELRKKNGMTQTELAEKLGITDKAVSKWERDLSCPDISLLPQIAEIFGISVDELMNCRVEKKESKADEHMNLIHLVLRALALAMGTATAVTAILDKIEIRPAMIMLGFGLACLAISSFMDEKEE